MMRKFSSIDGIIESGEISADFETAAQFDKLRIGKLGAYFRDGFKHRYIPFAQMERVFIRVNEVNGSLCCGNTIFQYFRLVFVCNGREYAELISEDEAAMDDALAQIRILSPSTAIGYVSTMAKA